MSGGLMPEHHWVMRPGENIPPEKQLLGGGAYTRERVREAAKFAIRAATDNGTILDFDPDALVQNLELAICGPCARCEPKGGCQ